MVALQDAVARQVEVLSKGNIALQDSESAAWWVRLAMSIYSVVEATADDFRSKADPNGPYPLEGAKQVADLYDQWLELAARVIARSDSLGRAVDGLPELFLTVKGVRAMRTVPLGFAAAAHEKERTGGVDRRFSSEEAKVELRGRMEQRRDRTA